MMFKYFMLLIGVVFALPRYSLQEATSCMSCHVNPTGSGMRNDYGSNIYSLEELPLERYVSSGDEDWDGYINDNIQIGGDFRIQAFKDGNETKLFPMQADIYANVDINKKANLYFKVDISRHLSDEYFVLLKDVFQNTWMKVGQSLPNYGIRLDDHTSFTRGGNINSIFSDDYAEYDEGLFFDISNEPPVLIEFGTKFNNLYLTFGMADNFITDESVDGFVNFSSSINSYYQLDDLSISTGLSVMKESDIKSYSFFGGFSVEKLSFLFEVDKVENWIQDLDSFATMLQMTYEPIQGLHLLAKYDYFDRNYDISSGTVGRKTLGFELYPLNILEIDFQIRQYELENLTTEGTEDTEFLIQVHSWF